MGKDFRRKWSTAEFFDNGEELIYEIKFEDGETVRRTGNHPLYAGWNFRPDFHKPYRGRIRPHEEGWLEVSELGGDHAVLCPDSTDFNFGYEECDEHLLKFLAYMIGDGCFRTKKNRLQFTQARNEQLQEFLRILDILKVKYTVSDKNKYNCPERKNIN